MATSICYHCDVISCCLAGRGKRRGSCHGSTSYVLNSGVTDPNLTRFPHNESKWLPINLLKSKLRYSNSLSECQCDEWKSIVKLWPSYRKNSTLYPLQLRGIRSVVDQTLHDVATLSLLLIRAFPYSDTAMRFGMPEQTVNAVNIEDCKNAKINWLQQQRPMDDSKTNASFIIDTQTSTTAENVVKVGRVLFEIFAGICRFLHIFKKLQFLLS